MSNQLTRFNRVRYRIYGNTFGSITISEPRGFQDDEKELLRSKKYLGIMTSLTSSLQFYGRAFQVLKQEYDINGIKAVVRIEREDRNDQTDIWELTYSAYFDFSTYQQEKNFISIKLNESQFFKNIEGRLKEKYELERIDDINGNPIPALQYETLSLEGRDIFRESLLKNPIDYWAYKSNTSLVLTAMTFPFNLIYRSDDNVFQPSVLVNDVTGQIDNATAFLPEIGDSSGGAGLMFYLNADNETEVTINVKGTFKFTSYGNGIFSFRIARYLYNSETNTLSSPIYHYLTDDEVIPLSEADGQLVINVDKTFTFNKRLTDSMTMHAILRSDIFPIRIDYDANASITIQENDLGETTEADALTVFNVFDRLLHIITGQQCFQSNLLMDEATWRDLLITNGFKIRKFLDKHITISLEEMIDSMMTIDDVALIIQNQTVRLEKKDYVFDNTGISVTLSQVSDVKRKIIEDMHFSSVEIGYDFDGKYEEVNGLDEFNIKNVYSTCIGNVENVFKAISKVRADAYGITLAQQKPFDNFPKLDTTFDKINFFLDAKKNGLIYELRHWQDDFADEPTGIFSPQTAFNLRLSPFNCVLRKGKTISTGLRKYLSERFRYSSTEGNSQLVTLYPERANELNSIFATPYFFPEQIEFEKKLSMAEFRQIVNNPYKLIKFVNEFGDYEYAYIYFSVKPNKEGKFQLVKANI